MPFAMSHRDYCQEDKRKNKKRIGLSTKNSEAGSSENRAQKRCRPTTHIDLEEMLKVFIKATLKGSITKDQLCGGPNDPYAATTTTGGTITPENNSFNQQRKHWLCRCIAYLMTLLCLPLQNSNVKRPHSRFYGELECMMISFPFLFLNFKRPPLQR